MSNYDYLTKAERQLLNNCPYKLTLTIEDLTNPFTKTRGNFDRQPRPQNSWIIFRKDFEANLRQLRPNVKQNIKDTAKESSLKWKEQSSEVKEFFKILAKIAYNRHKHTYPNYKYRPRKQQDENCKTFSFRIQKKYTFTTSAKHNSINISSVRGIAETNTSPSPSTNYMTNFTSHYNPHAFHNDVKISSTCTPIVNFSANFLDHRFLYDNNPNFFIFNSASIDAANTSIIPTALISLPTSQAQISIPEYLNYDSTYIAGNLSDITFEDV